MINSAINNPNSYGMADATYQAAGQEAGIRRELGDTNSLELGDTNSSIA